jgi:hypothetical protein
MPVDPDLVEAKSDADAIPLWDETTPMLPTPHLWKDVIFKVKGAVEAIVRYLNKNEGVIDCAVGQALIFYKYPQTTAENQTLNPNNILTPNGFQKYKGIWTVQGEERAIVAGTTKATGSAPANITGNANVNVTINHLPAHTHNVNGYTSQTVKPDNHTVKRMTGWVNLNPLLDRPPNSKYTYIPQGINAADGVFQWPVNGEGTIAAYSGKNVKFYNNNNTREKFRFLGEHEHKVNITSTSASSGSPTANISVMQPSKYYAVWVRTA